MSYVKNMNNINNVLESTDKSNKYYQASNSTLSDGLNLKTTIEKKSFTCFLCKAFFEEFTPYYTHYKKVHKTVLYNFHTSLSEHIGNDDDINSISSHDQKKMHRSNAIGIQPPEQNYRNQHTDTTKHIEPVTRNNWKIPNNERYKKLLKALILEKRSTGKVNKAKLIGPMFWKYALIKAGLIGNTNMIIPKKFPNQLKPQKCIACSKCFVSIPKITLDDCFIFTSQQPCRFCLKTEDEFILKVHMIQNHREPPPYICGKCLMVTDTWYDYVQHTIKHLRHKDLCNKCICS